MKTAREFFEYLPENIRTKAIANATLCCTIDENYESLEKAISGSFEWVDTPEGLLYWSGICKKVSLLYPMSLLLDKLKEHKGQLSTIIIRYEEVEKMAKSVIDEIVSDK